MDSLPDSRVTTKQGEVWICVNGPGTLHVSTHPVYGDQETSPYLTIRGIEYQASAHMIWIPEDVYGPKGSDSEGEIRVRKGWRVKPYTYGTGEDKRDNWNLREGLYASRKGAVSVDSVSSAARRSLVEVLEGAANSWGETPEACESIRQGSIRYLSNEARRDEEKIEELTGQIAELRASVKARDAEIRKLSR
jgi:hypothetical protein